jgi:hypothetical protein
MYPGGTGGPIAATGLSRDPPLPAGSLPGGSPAHFGGDPAGSPEGSPWHQSVSPAATSPAWTDAGFDPSPVPADYPPGVGPPPARPGPPAAPAPLDADAWDVSKEWDEDDAAAPAPAPATVRAAPPAPWPAPARQAAPAPPPPVRLPAPDLAPALAGDGEAWGDGAGALGYAALTPAAQRAPWQAGAQPGSGGRPPGLETLHPAAPSSATASSAPWLAPRGAHAQAAQPWPAAGGALGAPYGAAAAHGGGGRGAPATHARPAAAYNDFARQRPALAALPPVLLPAARPAPQGPPPFAGAPGYADVKAVLGRGDYTPSGATQGGGVQAWAAAPSARGGIRVNARTWPAARGYGSPPPEAAEPQLPSMELDDDDAFDFEAPPLPEACPAARCHARQRSAASLSRACCDAARVLKQQGHSESSGGMSDRTGCTRAFQGAACVGTCTCGGLISAGERTHAGPEPEEAVHTVIASRHGSDKRHLTQCRARRPTTRSRPRCRRTSRLRSRRRCRRTTSCRPCRPRAASPGPRLALAVCLAF